MLQVIKLVVAWRAVCALLSLHAWRTFEEIPIGKEIQNQWSRNSFQLIDKNQISHDWRFLFSCVFRSLRHERMGDRPFSTWNDFTRRTNRRSSICVLPSPDQERRPICQPRLLANRLQYQSHLAPLPLQNAGLTNMVVSRRLANRVQLRSLLKC